MATAALPLLFLPALALVDPPHGSAPPAIKADAALVLSGDVDYLRVKRAAQLYRSGSVPLILLTGSGVGGDSALGMREVALEEGVPADRLLLEERATSTRQNVLFSAPIVRARGFRRVALVTSRSHMGRAERVARKAMPEIEWIPVPVVDAGPRRHLYQTRVLEWPKLLWYALRGWI